ncbi:nuclear transport factor 2 family protein [soil metagenome]
MSTTTPAAAPSKPAGFQMPAPSPEQQATQKVGARLVELVSQGKNLDAIRELYADNVRSIEAMEGPGCPRMTEGKANVLKAAEHFEKITIKHSASCGKPLVNGNQFVCQMSLDCTSTEGPMANQRMQMSETALYTVKDGKISECKFFYSYGM